MRQTQERVDETRQAIDLFEHAAHGFVVFRRVRVSPSPTSPMPRITDSGVRSSCDASAVKRRSCSNDDSRRANVRVDHRGQPSNLVVLIGDRQTLVQAFGGDAPRLGRQVINRRQRPPCEHIAADSGQHDDQRKAEHEDAQHFP